jgi:hypothetical protein
MTIGNGLSVMEEALKKHQINILPLILDTALWVSPDTFKALPVWYPEFKRKGELYKANWLDRMPNKGEDKFEANVKAAEALRRALGIAKESDWTCCHIWGTDGFRDTNLIVQDSRFYSCVGNMVLLPTPLKAFTDSVPNIKFALRVLAYHLYGWVCEHELASRDAQLIRSGNIPEGYGPNYPHPGSPQLPPNIMPFNETIKKAITKRKAEIKADLENPALTFYPREEVRKTLEFWKINL